MHQTLNFELGTLNWELETCPATAAQLLSTLR
jgi:hypothetical protein